MKERFFKREGLERVSPPFIMIIHLHRYLRVRLVFSHSFTKNDLIDQADQCSVTNVLHNGRRPRKMNSDMTPTCSSGREKVVNSRPLSKRCVYF